MSCPERQQLLDRFRVAFDDYSAAVREQRSAPPSDDLLNRSAQAQTDCERLWAELQEHQSRHRCWP